MAITIDASVGGGSANAYCTLTEADTYHASHPYASVWDAATDDQQNRAIVTATRLLDEHIAWIGWVASSTQALLWPRSGGIYRNGYGIPSTVIPADLKRATAELARQLLAGDRTADSDIETQGITALSAGSVSLTFDAARVQVKVLPDAVTAMVGYLGAVKAQRLTCVPLVRM
jgi:hypothetical protein